MAVFDKGYFFLSDIGSSCAHALMNTAGDSNTHAAQKSKCSIYINPDFTLMIPQAETPSDMLYHILSHTDVIKNDVVIEAKIKKSSILRAYKRGMAISQFISALSSSALNEIPQNLQFMLTEWSNQSLRIDIGTVTLLKTNHPTFIDDLMYGPLKKCIIHRISADCAVCEHRPP